MAAVLVLTGGPDHAHDFAATGGAIAAVLTTAGHEVEVVDHPDTAAARLVARAPDVLVVNALRWRMHGDRYDPWRDRWAYETPPATRHAIAGFVAAGGGLVGSHTASICFDDWPGWLDVLGGAWSWDRSSHPPPAPVAVAVATGHPVVDGLPTRLQLVDEVYGDLDLAPHIEPLAHARRTTDDVLHPVVWAHQHGAGRVVYDGFGHDAESLLDPHHARLLRQAVDWVAA